MALGGSAPTQPVDNDGRVNSVTNENFMRSNAPPPPSVALRTWKEVVTGIDRSQTVVWRSAVSSLEYASQYILTSPDARRFVEGHMKPVISILLDQQSSKIGPMEKQCVEESLRIAVTIVAKDLESKITVSLGDCKVLDTLSQIFNRKRTYYKGSKPGWNVTYSGSPEVRMLMVNEFESNGGFLALAAYLENRSNVDTTNTVLANQHFPPSDVLQQVLNAIQEAVPANLPDNDENNNVSSSRSMLPSGISGVGKNRNVSNMVDTTTQICRAVMDYIDKMSEEELKKQANDALNRIRYALQVIYEKISSIRRVDTIAFYEFWRKLTLRLITSPSLPLRLFGWEQVGELIDASAEMKPPPKHFLVENAGRTFVNGVYTYDGPTDVKGYARPGGDNTYVRKIPKAVSDKDGGGKTLTLFRCTMRSQQKWWFLSEADEEQPGTDKDTDYYQHKSRQHEEAEPPPRGWMTCRNSGIDPPPMLQSSGLVVPDGEEYNTLEHQLAKWAIENDVIELVLGDSVHREVVSRSQSLLKFLGGMCTKDEEVSPMQVDSVLPSMDTGDTSDKRNAFPNAYCLKASHLLLAWKTCTSKADAAVSAEVYQVLVFILPSIPDDLAIPLLSVIQKSLHDGAENDKHDLLPEVAEFCSTLAASSPNESGENGQMSGNTVVKGMNISDIVRQEVLKLLWAVLTHQDAPSLKSYDELKCFVTRELRVDQFGKNHREGFLKSCQVALLANASINDCSLLNQDGEFLALHMVSLTRFILEACPRDQAEFLVTTDDAALPSLLFNELSAFLKRRLTSSTVVRKTSNELHQASGLSERLSILRFAYGLSEYTKMSSMQLELLWKLCAHHVDREALMIFLADASVDGMSLHQSSPMPSHQQTPQSGKDNLAAFSADVSLHAFQTLFCGEDVEWEMLGVGAYRSFQVFFSNLREMSHGSSAAGPEIDALWRIFLSAGVSEVASQAMKDLLAVYSGEDHPPVSSYVNVASTDVITSKQTSIGVPSVMQTDTEEEFVRRIFECLVEVKKGLEAGDKTSERSSERCLRILNAAVGQNNGQIGSGLSSSFSMDSVVQSDPTTSVRDVMKCIPHGMRSTASYCSISVLVKRAAQGSTASTNARDDSRNLFDDGNKSVSLPHSTASHPKYPSSQRFSLDVHPLETLGSVKAKVAKYCNHRQALIKPLSINGRQACVTGNGASNEKATVSLSIVPDDYKIAQVGISDGCEVVFLLAAQPLPVAPKSGGKSMGANAQLLDIGRFFSGHVHDEGNNLFDTLLAVLEVLPVKNQIGNIGSKSSNIDSPELVWNLLLAMPTHPSIVDSVSSAVFGKTHTSSIDNPATSDKMLVDSSSVGDTLNGIFDGSCFHRSVYTMQVVDSFLQPAPEVLSTFNDELCMKLNTEMVSNAELFRKAFIKTGGFDSVMRLFTDENQRRRRTRMGNAVAVRILKSCLFGKLSEDVDPDDPGQALLNNLSDPKGLLESLTAMVVDDVGVSDAAIQDVLRILLRLLSRDESTASLFTSLPSSLSEKFLIMLLLRDNGSLLTAATIQASAKVRRKTQDLILKIPSLAILSLPWLINALKHVDFSSDCTDEFFDVLKMLVQCGTDTTSNESHISNISSGPSGPQLKMLGIATCEKLASHPRPTPDNAGIDFSTGVLCGCLKLLRAVVEIGGGDALIEGAGILKRAFNVSPWSSNRDEDKNGGGMFDIIVNPFRSAGNVKGRDAALVDVMGVVFDGFLSPNDMSSTALCCDKDSRQLGFDVVAAAARSCDGGNSYLTLVKRIKDIISAASPSLRHRWLQNASIDGNWPLSSVSKYSGLRNQGCTCYMNSFLQQMFMMPGLKANLCAAPLPSCLRSTGGGAVAKGAELVGKRLSFQWENGQNYDAIVEGFNVVTTMHTVRYCPIPIATAGGHESHHNSTDMGYAEDSPLLPEEMQEEFFLTEGRPGKETGVFDTIAEGLDDSVGGNTAGESSGEALALPNLTGTEETEDEASSRRLLEEVQRTFVHLDDGVRGQCFDPRSLVEASACLKLEFDVWQQNDASEYAMKLLDRLEVALKRWAPRNFNYLTNTFGLKQTKQKICKECGLKTNREENLMNIDCQIRGKSDIHEALSTMCEVEYMEGDNKVFCDKCKIKCDTVLRTAISALPDMLVLSLKRFDLDYNTFETVKLNSRCAFGQTLNMKRYTLEGIEAAEKADKGGISTEEDQRSDVDGDAVMEGLDSSNGKMDDYQYNLVGVLVHAGVAQGGHYYSYIKDRSSANTGETEKWYRFDDEDVTAFDPSQIEVECFGGKVKKETKWPDGSVQTVESEQFANALMLFYEKSKPSANLHGKENTEIQGKVSVPVKDCSSGYDVFQSDVRRSNTTHKWHAFLFDSEFQHFLSGLLGLCLLNRCLGDSQDDMEISPPSPAPTISITDDPNWRLAVLQMSTSFLFDVLLHSADRGSFSKWVSKLESAFYRDQLAAKWFVQELARKTSELSGNWLRVFCTECPDSSCRIAAVRIISSALQSCMDSSQEQEALQGWIEAWNSQWESRQSQNSGKKTLAKTMPTKLEGVWKSKEETRGFGDGSASCVGVIISSLAALLEVAPRCWRNCAELFVLLRDIASLPDEKGGKLICKALLDSQIPARLICIALRERSPRQLQLAFPGASVSYELAEAVRGDALSSTTHMLPMASNNIGMGSGNGVNQSLPVAPDPTLLFEALGCLLGFNGVKREILLIESKGSKSRMLELSTAAKIALTTIFDESKSGKLGGMGENDINKYMIRCGMNTKYVHVQKIANILSKYHTSTFNDGKKVVKVLSLDGFLTYYRDTAQKNGGESQVRSDLHAFGFRPDLSRRSESCRSVDSIFESVSLDVHEVLGNKEIGPIGNLAELGLNFVHLYSYAYDNVGEALSCYVLACAVIGRNSSRLILDSLRVLSRAPTGNTGKNTVDTCLMIFKIVLSLPDKRQQDRIEMVMLSNEKAGPYANSGVGLLRASKELNELTGTQHYSSDFQYHIAVERYIMIVEALYRIGKVGDWLSQNKNTHAWMEEWGRSEFSRRDGAIHPTQAPLGHHSDSDMNPGLGNDSEDDDDDYQHLNIERRFGRILVQGAGTNAANGEYLLQEKKNDGTCIYAKEGFWQGNRDTFYLYRCQLSDKKRRWFISIVPAKSSPGTAKDTDFYWAPTKVGAGEQPGSLVENPPQQGWNVAKEGEAPAPSIVSKETCTVNNSFLEEDFNSTDADDIIDDDDGEQGRLL